jgi:hypothetical protein
MTTRRRRWVPALGRRLPPNCRRCDSNTIYCHRFAGQGGSREAALQLFRLWLAEPGQREFRNLISSELSGKVLTCSCAPSDRLCHCVALLEICDKPLEPPPENAGRRRR